MVFRLPTELESFIPPPSEQVLPSKPWRGTLMVTFRTSDKATNQDLRVTAVETDGDNRLDLWPSHLFVHPTYDNPMLRDVQAWVKRHAPPTCTFLPDRLRDANENAVNQTRFRSLSRILFENQMVAIALWNAQDRLPGGGIILYPAQNSTALLVGAIFLSSPFPDFVTHNPSTQLLHSPPTMSSRLPQHVGPSSAYGTIIRNTNSPAASSSYRLPHLANFASQTNTDAKNIPYQYVMSRTGHPVYPNTSSATWPVVKEEEKGDLPAFTSTSRTRGQGSQYPL